MARWPIDEWISASDHTIVRFQAGVEADFWGLHSPEHGCGWCFCSAWWVPDWEGWADRSSDQNRSIREELLARGEYDGYLLYRGNQPIGWSQVGPRDRLIKLRQQFNLELDPQAWAITCFLIHPGYRRRGYARSLLMAILGDLSSRGAKRVEAFPRRGIDPEPPDLWNGPEAIFVEAGFEVIVDDPVRPVLACAL